jgi:LysR family transcriptional regulator, regulator for metE and metH
MANALDSRHLRLVAEVARAENVTRAAERLHVTQSAVSHQLRELEDRLGTPLFVRSGRRMLATAAGRVLVDAAAGILATIDDVEHRVSQLARNVTGELRVAAHCYTGYHWLPAIVDGLRRRHPTIEVRIAPEYTLDPIAALLDARLDLAIVNDDASDPRLRYHELFQDEHVAVVPPSHPLARRPFVTLDELVAERLFLYSRSVDDSFLVQRVLQPAGIRIGRVTYLQLTEGILEMVKAGMGISVLPTWSIVNVVTSGSVKTLHVTRGGVFRTWFAAALRNVPSPPFVEEFIRLLANHGPSTALGGGGSAALGIRRRSSARRRAPASRT